MSARPQGCIHCRPRIESLLAEIERLKASYARIVAAYAHRIAPPPPVEVEMRECGYCHQQVGVRYEEHLVDHPCHALATTVEAESGEGNEPRIPLTVASAATAPWKTCTGNPPPEKPEPLQCSECGDPSVGCAKCCSGPPDDQAAG